MRRNFSCYTMETNNCNILELVIFFISLPTDISCFRITNCGSNKIKDINMSQNNKSIIEYDHSASMILNQPNRLEIWCESDSWFSECTLSHKPNRCNASLENFKPYQQTKNHMEAYKDFEKTNRHMCKFVVQKTFDCSGNILS